MFLNYPTQMIDMHFKVHTSTMSSSVTSPRGGGDKVAEAQLYTL